MAEKKRKVLVIGGGASGLMAAARASKLGADVLVLEKMERPGKKILITGKGRCNFTTGHDVETAIAAFGEGGRFLHSAFHSFYSKDIIAMLDSAGVPSKLERGKRYFPFSDRASDVAEALVAIVEKSGGEILCGAKVLRIDCQNNKVCGLTTSWTKPRDKKASTYIQADSIILATGGFSYPATGSTGDGHRFALALGHTIVDTRPALVPIELKGKVHTGLASLILRNTGVRLLKDGKVIYDEFGEIKFTGFGATGPTALNMGKLVADAKPGERLDLVVNFKPALTTEQVDRRLVREIAVAGGKPVTVVLETMLPRQAVPVFLKAAGIPADRKAAEITRQDREHLVEIFTGMSFPVKGPRPIEEAVVTAGGVSLTDINPRTMESKIVRGLYICGELLDIDGPTGGFNLQSAFSTGYLAGQAAATGGKSGKANVKSRDKGNNKDKSKVKINDKDRDKDRKDKDRSSAASRDKEVGRGENKNKSLDKNKDRSKVRSRDKEVSKTKSRDKDAGKTKGRDRDISKVKGRDKDRIKDRKDKGKSKGKGKAKTVRKP